MDISPILSPTELATLERLLTSYSAEKGPLILGSQLGQFVAQSIRPKTIQEIGGLRKVLAVDLQSLVKRGETAAGATDALYAIQPTQDAKPSARDFAIMARRPVEVAGRDLWRIFSNPRLQYDVFVEERGRIFASQPGAERLVNAQILAKPSAEDFRKLASQYTDRQDDLIVMGQLKAALETDDFYDGWIKELRRLRTPSSNLLREWEALKSEYVANRLHEELLRCGIDHAQAGKIVNLTRPLNRPQPNFGRNPALHSGVLPVANEAVPQVSEAADSEASFRRMIHSAINRMSISDLRELPIPAGLMYDASRETGH